MITGFNTDIEHDGVVYHVQTEDKGLETPIILSLVYVGGAILASKRAPYKDLIAKGFSDEALSERLKRQHKLICAAINSGRIEDLRKMTARAEHETTVVAQSTEPEPEPTETIAEAAPSEITVSPEPEFEAEDQRAETFAGHEPEFELEELEQKVVEEVEEAEESEFVFELEDVPSQSWIPPEKVEPPPEPETTVYDLDYVQGHSQQDAEVYDDLPVDGLAILLLDDAEFNSGESRTLRVLVVNRKGDNEKPLNGVSVSIKILGTTFRPLIYSLKTDRDGVATVATQIPRFTSGRAAVLVRAVAKDQAAELRRVIHPGN